MNVMRGPERNESGWHEVEKMWKCGKEGGEEEEKEEEEGEETLVRRKGRGEGGWWC